MQLQPAPNAKNNAIEADSKHAARVADRRGRLAEGFLLGTVIAYVVFELGLSFGVERKDAFLLPALIAALLSLTRARTFLRAFAALLLFGMAIVGYTPLVQKLIDSTVRSDHARFAPAVVVLSSAVFADKSLTSQAQERAITGYALLQQGFAPRLVLTESTNEFGSQVETVIGQMKALHLNYPVESAGPVVNTHDEALAVAALARKRGWKEVLLVTHPWHMRRASAVFEKAGIRVICVPCQEGGFNIHALNNASSRFRAFADWLHEAVGYHVYKWRGWI